MKWIIEHILGFIGTQKFLSAQLDITNNCNLACAHCYQQQHSRGQDLSIHDWQGILAQYAELIEKLHLRPQFTVSGGEPTISPLFGPILRAIGSRWPGVGIWVLSNWTQLSTGVVEEMKRAGARVQLSMEGPDADRHDSIRGPGSCARMMKGLSLLRGAGIPTTFQAVLSLRTAPWIPDFFETARHHGVAGMNFTRLVPQGRGSALTDRGVDRPLFGVELRDAYSAILENSRKTSIPTNTEGPLYVLISPELGAHGKAGFQGIIIDYQGNLKVTSRADFRLGDVRRDGLEKLFLHHPIMKALRDGAIEGCGGCRYYDRCGGDRNSSFVAYGSFLKKDPGCWLPGDGKEAR